MMSDLGVLNSYDTWHGKCKCFYEFNLNHRRYVLNRGKECDPGGQESGTRSSQR